MFHILFNFNMVSINLKQNYFQFRKQCTDHITPPLFYSHTNILNMHFVFKMMANKINCTIQKEKYFKHI